MATERAGEVMATERVGEVMATERAGAPRVGDDAAQISHSCQLQLPTSHSSHQRLLKVLLKAGVEAEVVVAEVVVAEVVEAEVVESKVMVVTIASLRRK